MNEIRNGTMMEPVDELAGEDLDVAIFQDDPVFILSCLNSDVDLTVCRDLRGKVLRKASYCHSVGTVKALLFTGKFLDVIDEGDIHGETPLHLAAKGSNLNSTSGKTPITTNHLLEAIYWLYKYGANPTLKSEEEETPKEIAYKENFKLGAIFLEILEHIWNGSCCTQSTLGYDNILCFHREILEWAVCTVVDDDIVRCILQMHSGTVDTKDSNIMHYLLGNTEGLRGHTLIHDVVRASPVLLETILTYSGLPLNVIANVQEEYIYGQENKRFVETPLCLALCSKSFNKFIDAFVRKQSGENRLTHINLSYTTITYFPVEAFKLQYMCTLNISYNALAEVSFPSLSDSCSLYDVNLSHNCLTSIPIEMFKLPYLKELDISNNPIDSLPDKWWFHSKNLKSLNLSHTQLSRLFPSDTKPVSTEIRSNLLPRRLTHKLPSRSRLLSKSEDIITLLDQNLEGSQLSYLNVSHASLDDFPKCFACHCPNLKHLDISHNNISSCCTIDEMPALLEELDMSHNRLQSEGSAIFSLADRDNHTCYSNSSYEDTVRCNHMRHNTLARLRKLNLSHNSGLENVVIHYDNLHKSVNLFFPQLKKLLLNNCNLLQLPVHLSKMVDLHTLHIGHNKELKIEKRICSMERLLTFNCDGLTDPLVSELNKFTTMREKLIFLRQIQSDSCEGAPAVKMMLMGFGSCGKTILLHCLRDINGNYSPLQPTVGISQETWLYPKESDPKMCFYVKDFSGKSSLVHQCYICHKSLYVLCWRVCDGLTAVKNLKEYLFAIKARGRYSAVVLVGTHIDLVDDFFKKKDKLVQTIRGIYSCQFYPDIKDIKFVSCKYKEGIEELRHCLYETAGQIKSYIGDKFYTQRLISMVIPASYYTLQRKILFAMNDGNMVVVWKDIVSLGEQCDLQKTEVLVAVTYIKEHGHFMDLGSVENETFCFVDSRWLFDVLTVIVTLQFDYTAATSDGKVSKVKLEESITRKLKLAPFLMDPIISLIQKCGLVIPLSSHMLLMPSLLRNIYPEKLFSTEQGNFPRRRHKNVYFDDCCTTPAQGIHLYSSATQQKMIDYIVLHFTGVCYRRIFLVNYLPINFWPKLISRLLPPGNSNSFHNIICNNCIPEISYKTIATGDTAVIGNMLCKWSCWKNCIELSLGEHIVFRINAFYIVDSTNKKKIPISATMNKLANGMLIYTQYTQYTTDVSDVSDEMKYEEGFEISVPDYEMISRTQQSGKVHYSNAMSAQILSHILEIVDEVLKDWFEGKLDNGIYSSSYALQLIPCPYCYNDKRVNGSQTLEFSKYDDSYDCLNNISVAFTIWLILLQVRKSDTINCCHHGSLKIKYLAPDVVFDDILVEKIEAAQLELQSEILGKGGFGKVDKMNYLKRDLMVAVKTYSQAASDSVGDGIPLTYSLVRQELNKVLSIDHPNVVQFIGFCTSTLSFVMECAPFGNLKDLIKAYKHTGYFLCPESLVETVKQVSSALAYLHNKTIVHYDIKPDNILVFSFPQTGHDCFTTKDDDKSLRCRTCQNGGTLVKLADLGVSAFVGPEGFYRKPATPGHTAPEALEYHGLEPLGEKVDIFSLGMTIYELMTLQLLPPLSINSNDFNWNIRNGVRPSLLTKEDDPMYPIVLKELVVNCWAQEYAARPTAQEIVSILQSPDCLKLINTYNTELPYSVVSAALVVTVGDQQSLWLAHTSDDDDYEVSVYEFAELGNSNHVNLFKCAPIQVEAPVRSMCQLGVYVWMASQHGTLTVVSVTTLTIVHQAEHFELDNEDLVEIVTTDSWDKLLALAYRSGIVVFLKIHPSFLLHSNDLQNFKIDIDSIILTSRPQLCTVEVCNNKNSDLWCGCGSNTIKIITTPCGDSQPFVRVTFSAHTSSKDISPESSILQLKSWLHSTSNVMHMFALHDCGSVISCWSVGDQPTLVTVIILDQLHSPASIILPLGTNLYITDTRGSVYCVSLNEVINDSEGYGCHLLLHHHQAALLEHLFMLQGRMNTKGLLTNIGSVPDKDNFTTSPHVCCDVLFGMGVGYQGLFKHNHCNSDQNLHFIIWILPKT